VKSCQPLKALWLSRGRSDVGAWTTWESLNHLCTNRLLGQHAHRTEGALHCCCPLQAMHALGVSTVKLQKQLVLLLCATAGLGGNSMQELCCPCVRLVMFVALATVVGTSKAMIMRHSIRSSCPHPVGGGVRWIDEQQCLPSSGAPQPADVRTASCALADDSTPYILTHSSSGCQDCAFGPACQCWSNMCRGRRASRVHQGCALAYPGAVHPPSS